MGSRGPLPKAKKVTAKTARGAKLTQLPEDADAIFRRLAGDVAGLTVADIALLENTAMWVAISKAAYARLLGSEKQPTDEQLEKQEAEVAADALTVPDTAHGSRSEPRKNPLLIVMRTASDQLRANLQQLGATPMARARMPEVDSEDDDPVIGLFAEAKRIVDKKV